MTDLRTRRLRAGLTQARVAELAGLDQATVSRIERGTVKALYESRLAIERALDRATQRP